MRPHAPTRSLLAAILFLLAVPRPTVPQSNAERFELRGKVVNTVSGEPVARALVQIPGQPARFSDSDGAFAFADLPSGRTDLSAIKPGFFNERQLGASIVPDTSVDVPSGATVLVKLIPEGVIYGEVKNSEGQPMEGVTVRALRWLMVDGRRQLVTQKNAVTDDEGNFRLAELVPGKFYLTFLPGNQGGNMQLALWRKRKQVREGYGMQFYPGVADVSSASALRVRAGAQIHVIHNFVRQQLFQISGTVQGAALGRVITLELRDASGEPVQSQSRIDQKTGDFQISGIPAGNYLLMVNLLRQRSGSSDIDPPQNAMQAVHVAGDLSGVVVTPGSGISVAVQLRDESSGNASEPRPVLIRMVHKDFAQNVANITIPLPPGDSRPANRLENLSPGTYTVEAQPLSPLAYVAESRCGSLDLLRDDLVLGPGSAPPPIVVTLRNDVAQLTVGLRQKMRPAAILVYSSEYPRRSVLMPFSPLSPTVSFPSLPPGSYQVLALADVGDLEYRNPVAMEKYLAHAASLTLEPHDRTTVSVDVLDSLEQLE